MVRMFQTNFIIARSHCWRPGAVIKRRHDWQMNEPMETRANLLKAKQENEHTEKHKSHL